MAENTLLANGDTFAADDISGVKFQRIKLITGNNNVNDGDVSASNPLAVIGVADAATGAAVPAKATLMGASDGTNLLGLRAKTSNPIGTEAGLIVRPINIERQTYSASALGIVPAATATDVFTLTGSASKTVRIRRITVSGTQTVAGIVNLVIAKRSTANTGGTSTAPTAVAHDSTNSAATATVLAYTANPTTGTLVGNLITHKLLVPAPASLAEADRDIQYDLPNSQPLVLRGVAEVIAINLNSATVTGGNLNITVLWNEE